MIEGNIKKSAYMALVLGILLPLLETIRRVNQLLDPRSFLEWFDDYLAGAVLLTFSIRALKRRKGYSSHLIVIWGMAFGGHMLSLLSQIQHLYTPHGEKGIFSAFFVFVVKILIMIYIIIGLRYSIKGNERLLIMHQM